MDFLSATQNVPLWCFSKQRFAVFTSEISVTSSIRKCFHRTFGISVNFIRWTSQAQLTLKLIMLLALVSAKECKHCPLSLQIIFWNSHLDFAFSFPTLSRPPLLIDISHVYTHLISRISLSFVPHPLWRSIWPGHQQFEATVKPCSLPATNLTELLLVKLWVAG